MKTNKNSITKGLICELILCKKGMNLLGNKFLTLIFSFIFSSFLVNSNVLGCGLNTIGSFSVCVNNNITLSPNLGPNCQNIDYIVWTATDDQNNTVVFATNYAPNINGSVIFNSNTPGIYTINIQGWYNNSPTPFWESNNFGTVHVLDGPPTGNFIPPFVSCSGSPTYIQFNSQNSTSQNLNLPNNSYINYGVQKLEISNEQKDLSLNVFPNPAKEILCIESDKAIHRIEMCDVMGKTIYTVQGNGNQLMNIPVKDFAKGIYLVKVFDQKNSFTTKKLSINH